MILTLNNFNSQGNILAYKNPTGKNTALAEYVIDSCISQGRLANNKLVIASSGRLGVDFAKACKNKNVQFLPMLGEREDLIAFAEIAALGYKIDRTPLTARDARIEELKSQGWYYFDQFNDYTIIDYYKSEANKALSELGEIKPDLFIDFIGSGATFRGFYEVLQGICGCGYANSCYKDETKFERKLFVRDIIRSGIGAELIDVQSSYASNLVARYEQGEFGIMGKVSRTFFTSIQGAINWLEVHPGKTVLLYWED